MTYIITPIYNAERFVTETIRSVQAQTVSEWRLVLVNDCSTDRTLEVVTKLANEDRRLIVLNALINGGPSKARNIGIEYALEHHADFIAFIDSDDLYETNFLAEMLQCIESTKTDMTWCGYYEEVPNVKRLERIEEKMPPLLEPHQFANLFFKETVGLTNIWSKVYRAEFLRNNKILMNEDRVCGEDWEFNYSCCMVGAKVSYVDKPLYHYLIQNNASVMTAYHSEDYPNHYNSLLLEEKMAHKYNINYDKKDRISRHLYWSVSIIHALALSKKIEDKKAELRNITKSESWLSTIKEGNYDMRYMSRQDRLFFWLLKHKYNSLCLKMMTLIK